VTTTRYPNQFKVRGSGSPNIISLGFAPRSLAKSHAWSLAAWLVTYVGDLPSFLNVLIDVWVSRYGIEQTPEWLFQLNPNWKPFDPPARPMAPIAVTAPPVGPVAVPSTAPRQGSGPGAPRFTLPDGTPLDADAVRAIGEEAARALGAGSGGNGARAANGKKPIIAPEPTSLPKPIVDTSGESEGGDDAE
jgi:hypothetical protein